MVDVSAIQRIIQDIMGPDYSFPNGFGLETNLYDEGLGLDSTDAAALSAVLENEFDHDPYSKGVFPQTVGDIVKYYASGQV